MASDDLRTEEGLRAACQDLLKDPQQIRASLPWFDDLQQRVVESREATDEHLARADFHERFWSDLEFPTTWHAYPVGSAAAESEEFRAWFVHEARRPSPSSLEDRTSLVRAIQREGGAMLVPPLNAKPTLRLLRGFSIFHPDVLTFVQDSPTVRAVEELLGSDTLGKGGRRSLLVARRLEQVLGPTGSDPESVAQRLALPYLLIASHGGSGVWNGSLEEERVLTPLPAAQRKRGLTALRGRLEGFYPVLEFLKGGASRDEVFEFIQSQAGDLKQVTLYAWLRTLRAEFDIIEKRGSEFVPSPRGRRLLEQRDPFVLADFLVTQVLGVDEALVRLRDDGPTEGDELYSAIQGMNPGWTTTYIPASIVSWLRSFDAVQRSDDGRFSLTESGEQWADLVTWDPEPFVPEELEAEPEEGSTPDASPLNPRVALPPFSAIRDRIASTGKYHFPDALIAQLHAGLWASEMRHFAVLAGLSGSGKTVLARQYALALAANDATGKKRLLTVTVQPGWYDPSPMLGYVNPLREESYVRTEFLEFLLAAALHPGEPFVAVLDEMNLSHPEQYLAPLLSAMETGAPIHLHGEGDRLDGVPAQLAYPSNLVLIGTVNMDETTHGLSDKVLDRAFTLEFWDIDLQHYPKWEGRSLSAQTMTTARRVLEDLMGSLAPARMHFGWRVVDEVLGFLERSEIDGGGLTMVEALDAVVYAKVLPKLRGEDAPRFREALRATGEVLKTHGLERSRSKLAELEEDLEHRGSARFWR